VISFSSNLGKVGHNPVGELSVVARTVAGNHRNRNLLNNRALCCLRVADLKRASTGFSLLLKSLPTLRVEPPGLPQSRNSQGMSTAATRSRGPAVAESGFRSFNRIRLRC